MKYILLLSLFALASCNRAYVYPTHMKKAEEICKDKGGLHHIESESAGNGSCRNSNCGGRYAVCNNKDSESTYEQDYELK
jgi:hypothetical protein